MTSSTRTCTVLRDYLDLRDPAEPKNRQGRRMLTDRLQEYLRWKSYLHKMEKSTKSNSALKQDAPLAPEKPRAALSEALVKKDKERMERAVKRRRIRGGAPGSCSRAESQTQDAISGEAEISMDPPQGFVFNCPKQPFG